jgi:hypothetical protein
MGVATMSMIQELKQPWIKLPRLLVLYGVAGIIGVGALVCLHVMFPDNSTQTPDARPNADSKQATPYIVPSRLSPDLMSALPSGSEWTIMNVSKWNEIVGNASKVDYGSSVNSPSLGQKQAYDENFLSEVRSLPILNKKGKIIAILDSKQLQAFSIDKGIKFLSANSVESDRNDVPQKDIPRTGWTTKPIPKEDLLKMKVVEYVSQK